jgi:hypothetical protein
MKKYLIISSVLFIVLFTGCVKEEPPIYIWNDYANSSFDYVKRSHEKEVFIKHLDEVGKIITDSELKKQRVPPGIYAEYGKLLIENDKKDEAMKYFSLEKQTYPESSIFIDKLIERLYGKGVSK